MKEAKKLIEDKRLEKMAVLYKEGNETVRSIMVGMTNLLLAAQNGAEEDAAGESEG